VRNWTHRLLLLPELDEGGATVSRSTETEERCIAVTKII
jgi:hypothetical protein